MKKIRFLCLCLVAMLLIPTVTTASYTESKQAMIKKNDEFLSIKASEANAQQGTTIVGDCVWMEKNGYVLFKSVKFTDDIKYVTIKASRHSGEEERFLFRINSPTGGEIIADCKVEETGSLDTFKEFTYSVTVSPGTYDLYIVAEFGSLNSNGGLAGTYLDSFRFSDRNDSVPEFEEPKANVIDNYHDTWVAVDGAGRAIADYEETGDVKEDKYVAMFYWSWHEDWGQRQAPVNVSSILEQHPEIMYDNKSELWPPAAAYFWAEPLFGYYRLDPWVLRKHAQMLANAGVDVIVFDCTNNDTTWETGYSAILREFSKARADGINAPKVAFMSNFSAVTETANCLTKIYKSIYRDGKYKDSWFYWKGKPLVMAYPDSLNNPGTDPEKQELYNEIKEFFTFREPQSSYISGPSNNNQWGWLEQYPQHKYVENEDGSCEQVTAGIAQNFSYATKSLAAMNDKFAQGRSYTARYGEDLSENAWDYGYNFKEQFEYAIELDPELIFVTGWNEWIAGRFDNWHGTDNAFPDQCNYERSRDIEPVKGKYGDNYYYQLVDFVRKFKGTRPVPSASAEKTIDINGDISQWNDVGPEFINDKGTTIHRDADGYLGTHYTNTTGRNDILRAKVARDKEYITFYAQTDETLTSKDGQNWMTLYINADRNHATGWEGYDFVVNRISPDEKAYLEYNDTGEWEWKALSEVEYSIQDNVLQVKIPREALGLTEDEIDIEFKWTDNIETAGDPINFWVDGCSAPCGRFNYRYTTRESVQLDEATKEDLTDKIIIQEGSPNMYVGASKTLLYDADRRAVPFTEGDNIYIPAMAVEKMIYGSKVEIGDAYITIKSDEKTLRLYRDNTCRLNGVLLETSYRIIERNNVDYVDAEILSDIFEKSLRKEDNKIYTFSEEEVQDTTLKIVNELLK